MGEMESQRSRLDMKKPDFAAKKTAFKCKIYHIEISNLELKF
jgi:hypothetical protein